MSRPADQDSFTVVRGCVFAYFPLTKRPVTALRALPVEPPPLASCKVVFGLALPCFSVT